VFVGLGPTTPSGITTASTPISRSRALRLMPHPRRTIDKGVSDTTVPQTATEPTRYSRLYHALRTACLPQVLALARAPDSASGVAMPPSAGAEIDRPRRRTRTDCPLRAPTPSYPDTERRSARSKPLCVKGGLLGALKHARGGGRRVVVGPGVTDPKCWCRGASRPRWIQSRP
jgi:hypothetical protein